MISEVNLERFDKALSALEESTNPKYSIDNFIRENNIEYKTNGQFMLLKCFVNSDNNPSMKISTVKNEYKCFSCGSSGKFIKFVSDYYESVGKVSKQSVIVENFLKSDRTLQDFCGFKSIFVNKVDSIELIISKLKEESNKPLSIKPTFNNTLQVVNHLSRKKSLSKEDKKSLMYYIQEGIQPNEIVDLMNKSVNKKFSLEGVVNG